MGVGVERGVRWGTERDADLENQEHPVLTPPPPEPGQDPPRQPFCTWLCWLDLGVRRFWSQRKELPSLRPAQSQDYLHNSNPDLEHATTGRHLQDPNLLQQCTVVGGGLSRGWEGGAGPFLPVALKCLFTAKSQLGSNSSRVRRGPCQVWAKNRLGGRVNSPSPHAGGLICGWREGHTGLPFAPGMSATAATTWNEGRVPATGPDQAPPPSLWLVPGGAACSLSPGSFSLCQAPCQAERVPLLPSPGSPPAWPCP